MKRTVAKYDPKYVLQVYKLARDGFADSGIAQVLGITTTRLAKWCIKHPELDDALDEGREEAKKRTPNSEIKEYIYGRLSPDLQKIWKEIDVDLEDGEEDQERAFKALSLCDTQQRQMLFLHALAVGTFNMTEACRKVGIGISTPAMWARKDAKFARLFNEIDLQKKEFLQSAYWKLVGAGSESAILYGCRALLKKEGFNEKVEIEVNHKHEHQHSVKISDLPLEMKKKLLQIKMQKEKEAVQDADFEEKRS